MSRGWLLAPLLAWSCGGDNMEPGPESDRNMVALSVESRLPLEEPPGDPVGGIAALTVQSDGGVLIVDRLQANIKRFRTDGSFEGTWGRPGDGPAEFRYPVAAAPVGDSILVLDLRRARISIFSATGQYLSSWPVPGTFVGGMAVDGAMQGRVAVAAKTFGRRSPWGAARHKEILVLENDGLVNASMGSLEPPVSPIQSAFQTVVLAAGGGTIVYGSMDTDRVQAIRWNGTTLASVSAGGPDYRVIDWSEAPEEPALWDWLEGAELLSKIIWVGDDRFLVRFDRVGDESTYRYSLVSLSGDGAHWLGSTQPMSIAAEWWDGSALWGYEWREGGTINLLRLHLTHRQSRSLGIDTGSPRDAP